jgi:chorismate mutase
MNESLENLRKQIDELDEELLNIFAKRMGVVLKIGALKRATGVPPLDAVRWQSLLDSKRSKAISLGLSEKFVESAYYLIHEYSLEIQSDGGQSRT